MAAGKKIPLVGLGTWLADNESELETALETALKLGYRHIDTAFIYGNEAVIGRVLKRWLDSGKLKRDDLYIVTKLPICGMRPEKVPYFMDLSLKSLQLDFVDLYLIHVPFGTDAVSEKDPIPVRDGQVVLDPSTNLEAIWTAMESLVEKGMTKAIGISNFDSSQIERIVNHSVKHRPSALQAECHLYFQQKELRSVCSKHGITFCAYSPLGSPGRTQFYKAVGLNFSYNHLLDDPTIARIAKKHGKSNGQICLKFLVQLGISVIPKSTNESRLKDNLEIMAFTLDDKDVSELENLDKGKQGRTMDFSFLPGIQKHPQFPKDMIQK